MFYLHSRLLERAAKVTADQKVAEQMNDLPESLKGKVKGRVPSPRCRSSRPRRVTCRPTSPPTSSPSPTGDLPGEQPVPERCAPAINVGISVSRVGGNAQIEHEEGGPAP